MCSPVEGRFRDLIAPHIEKYHSVMDRLVLDLEEKETQDMRNSIEYGDVIVTNGGIVGMVVKITEDMLLIETSGSRTKIQIQKWAVHRVLEKANEEPEEEK